MPGHRKKSAPTRGEVNGKLVRRAERNPLTRRIRAAALLRELRGFLRSWARQSRADQVQHLSAEMAYHFLFALIPGLFVLAMGLGRFGQHPQVLDRVFAFFSGSLPPSAFDLVRAELLAVTRRPFSLSLAAINLLLMLWSGARYLEVMLRCLDHGQHRPIAPAWLSHCLSGFVVFLFPPILVISLNLMLFGESVLRLIVSRAGLNLNAAQVLEWARTPATAVVLFLMVWVVYRFAPRVRRRGLPAMPGALFFVASWTAITGLFRWYVGHLGKFGVTYGTLGVVIVLLSWLYLTSLLLLLGAELNSALLSRAPADDVQSAGQSDGSRRPPPEESPDNS